MARLMHGCQDKYCCGRMYYGCPLSARLDAPTPLPLPGPAALLIGGGCLCWCRSASTDRHVAGRGERKKIDVIERSEDYERGRTRDEVLTKLRSPGPYPPDRP